MAVRTERTVPTQGLRSHTPTRHPLVGLEDILEVYALTRMANEVAQATTLAGWAKKQI